MNWGIPKAHGLRPGLGSLRAETPTGRLRLESCRRTNSAASSEYPSREAGGTPKLFRGLRALQHRGQESAGIATTSHGVLHLRKGMGLVHEIFTEELVDALRGTTGIGHTRYSTTGTSDLENAQPLVVKVRGEDAAIAHNGDLVNFERIRRRLQAQGVELMGSADSETMAQMIAIEYGRTRDLEPAIRRACAELVGGYAVVLIVGNRIAAFRDPLGIRPLVLGSLEGGWRSRASRSPSS
ncbi:amidophosphoribosyltransferase [mine drainage metagenome]|uniref:Amidophosphoribosyltransferase n=1 Tax=mine drainage metagenome TaxID=410659 RepID=T1CVB6_9ZZZZ